MYFICFLMTCLQICFFFFFFNDTATTEIYTLSLHDALPILARVFQPRGKEMNSLDRVIEERDLDFSKIMLTEFPRQTLDRKSTRLNSSHLVISYAVFCLKKKKTQNQDFINNIHY